MFLTIEYLHILFKLALIEFLLNSYQKKFSTQNTLRGRTNPCFYKIDPETFIFANNFLIQYPFKYNIRSGINRMMVGGTLQC